MARDTTTRPHLKPEAFNDPGRAPGSKGRRNWLSVPYLLASVLVPSLFATQQMSFLRNAGPDLHWLGVAVCALGALIGAFALVRMKSRRRSDRSDKVAVVATLAGSLIFIVGAAVMASTHNEGAPRVGGIEGEAVQ